MTGKISGLFFNTSSDGYKYSLLNRDDLTQPTQMQLSLKGKKFFSIFSKFLTCRLSFEHFQKKNMSSILCEVNATVFFYKYYKYLKRKINLPQ